MADRTGLPRLTDVHSAKKRSLGPAEPRACGSARVARQRSPTSHTSELGERTEGSADARRRGGTVCFRRQPPPSPTLRGRSVDGPETGTALRVPTRSSCQCDCRARKGNRERLYAARKPSHPDHPAPRPASLGNRSDSGRNATGSPGFQGSVPAEIRKWISLIAQTIYHRLSPFIVASRQDDEQSLFSPGALRRPACVFL